MASDPTHDLDRLLRTLREDPEGRAQLRALLTDQRLDALAEAQVRTEQSLQVLVRRVEALAEAQVGTEQRLEALAEAQGRTEQRLEALAEAMTRLAERVGDLSAKVDRLVGADIERRYRERPHTYFHAIARRMKLLSSAELDTVLDAAVADGTLTAVEATEVRLADGVFRGRRVEGEGEVYVVLEVSVGVGPSDVQRARRRADLLARTGAEAVAVVAGTWVVPEAAEAASAHAVWQVTDGQAVGPAT